MALKPVSDEPLDLDVDLSQVDTSMPVLAGGLYDLRIHDIVREANKDKNGNNLVVTFVTVENHPSIQNPDNPSAIKKDFPIKAWYPLQAKPDAADKDGYKKNLAMLLDAACGSSLEAGNRPPFSKSILLNKIVRATLKVEDFDGRPTNKVGNLVHPEAS